MANLVHNTEMSPVCAATIMRKLLNNPEGWRSGVTAERGGGNGVPRGKKLLPGQNGESCIQKITTSILNQSSAHSSFSQIKMDSFPVFT